MVQGAWGVGMIQALPLRPLIKPLDAEDRVAFQVRGFIQSGNPPALASPERVWSGRYPSAEFFLTDLVFTPHGFGRNAVRVGIRVNTL